MSKNGGLDVLMRVAQSEGSAAVRSKLAQTKLSPDKINNLVMALEQDPTGNRADNLADVDSEIRKALQALR